MKGELPKVDKIQLKAIIEAVLFAAGYPVSYEKLTEAAECTTLELMPLLHEMAEEYSNRANGRGIQLVMFEEACQFCTKEQYAPYIREALGIRRGGNLSASSLEVLAVVAYNQPVTRAYVDEVRGVDSSYAMNSLIDKALIEACGRLDAPGRPMLYVTTEKFLRVFGINSLSELPATETLVPPKEETPMVAIDEGELSDDEGGITIETEAD